MRTFTLAAAATLLLLSITASAQTVSIGTVPLNFALTRTGSGAGLTLIDLSHPATANGGLTTATVHWYSAIACSSSYKLKFLRPFNGTQYQVTDERGPFNSDVGFFTIALNPQVLVQKGDLIAVTQLQTTSCGGVALAAGPEAESTLEVTGDPAIGATISTGTLLHSLTVSARAGSASTYVAGVIPAVGTVAGAGGTQFKTSIHLSNSENGTLSGHLVLHPAGASGSSSDPSFNYSLAAFQSLTIADLGAQFGVTGLGSIDVVATNGTLPAVLTRIFNDAGSGGTQGFTEKAFTPDDALRAGESAILQLPTDSTNFRVNVGVRTLDEGAQLSITTLTPQGSFIGSPVTKTYPANYFEQPKASDFIGSLSLPAGGTISVQVVTGRAYIYASTTDNRTGDSSAQFGSHQ